MKRIITALIAILVSISLSAQAPQKMSYQAVVRNSSNELVKSSPIGMRISILQGSATGTEVFKEIYNPNPLTNSNGLITVEIGGGFILTGSFSNIDWATGPYFLKTEIDPSGGTNYTITGTTQLLSVPYALHSKTAESLSGGITETDPVYGASPAKGITASSISNWTTAYGWGNHSSAGYLKSYTETDPIWTAASANYYNKTNMQTSGGSQVHFGNITSKPTTLAGYGITDAFNGTWTSLTGKPITIAGYGITDAFNGTWTSLTGKPTTIAGFGITDAFNGTWTSLSGKPSTIAGYGITDAMSTTHVANGITATSITNWNTAYGWGNHSGLYRPISYVPAWSEMTSNPFAFTSVANNQIIRYNSTSGKWENWTPTYLTSYSETDPLFGAWNKSTGVNISASQVNDFQTSVTNNLAVLANTAKNSYPAIDAAKVSGIATGAEVNVNADWNAASGDAQIQNKPTLASIATSGSFIDLTGKPTTVSGYGITDAVASSIVQNGSLIYAAATGSSNAFTVTLSPVPSAYVTGMFVNFKANLDITGPTTININGLGLKSIKKQVVNDLFSGDIKTNQMISLIYDGTNFQLLSYPLTNLNLIQHGMSMITTTGTSSFIVPAGITVLKINMVGAGGGGNAYGTGPSAGNYGSPGAGGPYFYGIIKVNPGETLYFTIGIGGAGSKSTTSWASVGGTSTITDASSNILLTLNGGGTRTVQGVAAEGGTGSINNPTKVYGTITNGDPSIVITNNIQYYGSGVASPFSKPNGYPNNISIFRINNVVYGAGGSGNSSSPLDPVFSGYSGMCMIEW